MSPDSLFRPIDDAIDVIPLGGGRGVRHEPHPLRPRRKWLMVDLGMGFAGDAVPGVDLLVPDPTFITERKKDPCRPGADPRP